MSLYYRDTSVSVWKASVEMASIIRDIMLVSRVFVPACTTEIPV